MTTFEVGKTYYNIAYYVDKLEVVKKTNYFVWIKNKHNEIKKKKIRYTDNNEEYIFYIYQRVRLYSSCKWCKYWKIGKNDEGYEIIIKEDYKEFYKMNTATLKMFKFVVSMWGLGQVDWCEENTEDCEYDYQYLVKQMVEDNTEDFDEDYYCLYYTSNKDINWDMIDALMYRSYMIGMK